MVGHRPGRETAAAPPSVTAGVNGDEGGLLRDEREICFKIRTRAPDPLLGCFEINAIAA